MHITHCPAYAGCSLQCEDPPGPKDSKGCWPLLRCLPTEAQLVVPKGGTGEAVRVRWAEGRSYGTLLPRGKVAVRRKVKHFLA